MLRFDALQAPPGDGETLIEPALPGWSALVEDSIRLRAVQNITLAGVPVETAREEARSRRLGLDPDARVIACGHQPEFVHAGVWAKHVVVHHAARELGAVGIDLVVDHDAPASFALQVPVGGDDLLSTRETAFGPTLAGLAYEGRPPLAAEVLDAIRAELTAVMGERFEGSVMPAYLDGLAAQTPATDAVDQHMAARADIDRSLTADLREARVSQVFGGPFLAHLLLDADRFRAAYNESLAEYRQEHRVRGADRPLPDLGRDAGRTETALWIYQPRQKRRRLWIERRAAGIELFADDQHVGTAGADDLIREPDAALAGVHPWVIRPRALTLTLWSRLLICDLFVHGIGGAKYDRITDGILRRFHGVDPPPYTCVSATLRLPLPRQPSTPIDLSEARRRVRDWSYNPDRYIPDPPSDLLAERSRLIRESDRLRQTRAPQNQRRQAFLGIRRANARLADGHPDVGQRLAAQLGRIRREVESNRIADRREYFYALQSRDRLAMLGRRLISPGIRPAPDVV